jgi:DNA-binding NtrC family response regulator
MGLTQAKEEQRAEASGHGREYTILVIDDEESFQDSFARFLKGYRVLRAYNGWQALDMLAKHHVDVIFLDLNLPDTQGMGLLEQIRAERDDVEVIVITAHSAVRNAVDAVKRGAFDFLAKSYENYKHIDEHIQRALRHRQARREKKEIKTREAWMRDAFALLENSESKALCEIVTLLRRVADTPLTVLLEGESGVGKEILARYLHALSDRAGGPFIPVNLSAVPDQLIESHLFGHTKGAFTGADRGQEGKFELADGGTLFLDEIGEVNLQAQVKILRVLQEREVERVGSREPSPVDVRVIAATNKDLTAEVRAGRFREDLYFRLNVVRLKVPPLRERKQDLPELCKLLISKHALQMQREAPHISREAQLVLAGYDWPGNVRELENLIMRLVAIHPGRSISVDDVPPEYFLPTLNRLANKVAKRVHRSEDGERGLYFLARDQFERYLVRLTVNRFRGDKEAAARALGIGLSTLKEKLRGVPTDLFDDL